MAGDQPRPIIFPGALSPEQVGRRSFGTRFRGYDTSEVSEFLQALADELRRLASREEELVRELKEARARAASPNLDEQTLTEALGHEAARILHSAHEAGADIRRKAEESAARILRDAHQQAESIRGAAESVLDERMTEAERAAEAVRAAAHTEATGVVARARQEAEAALSEARARFDAMSEEAEALKNRILSELGRRRRVMLAQVEQLSAGRDSMLRAVADVRSLIDQVTGSLEGIEAEAKSAADQALERARRQSELDPAFAQDLVPMELGAAGLGKPPPSPAEIIRIAPVEALAAPAATAPGAAPDAQETAATAAQATAATAAQATVPATPDAQATVPATPDAQATVPATPDAQATVPATPEAQATVPATPEAQATVPATPEAQATPDTQPPSGQELPAEVRRTTRSGERPAGEASGRQEPGAEHAPAEVPSEPDGAGRRGLRLLRRGRGEGVRMGAQSPDAVDEGVRLIRAEPAVSDPAPPAPAEAPAPAEPPVGLEPAASVEGSEATAPAGGRGEEGSPHAAPVSVDELFARLRADRAVAVGAAEGVLADAGIQPGAATSEPAESTPREEPAEPPTGRSAGGPVAQEAAPSGSADGPPPEAVGSADGPAGHDDPGPRLEDELLDERDSRLAVIQDQLARKLKRSLQDDQNDLLDRVRNSSRHRDRAVLPAEEEQCRRFEEAAGSLLGEAFDQGAGFARSRVPGSSPGSAGGDLAARLAGDLVGQLRPRLEHALTGEPGTDEAATAEAIGSVYRSWKGERIEGLATDHLIDAFHSGVLAALPPGSRLRWVVDDDGGPCPDCDDNALAGPTPAGSEYPTGQVHPPAHPRCRCLLVPDLT